jgi:SAM-dependent methyltransferase
MEISTRMCDNGRRAARGCRFRMTFLPHELEPSRPRTRTPDVIFVATPEHMVPVMLTTARVSSNDVLYDLGCGDGRLVIEAAKQCGARGVGIDIDPVRIAESRANAERAGVSTLTTFVEADMFESSLAPATVVMLYLIPSLNRRLRPKLLHELNPGARVLSLGFDMEDWSPVETVDYAGRLLYLWNIERDHR